MNDIELKKVLETHSVWLKDSSKGSKADLSGAYLREADLMEANLMEANLREVDLRGANLRKAYLREADLSGANLREANLQRADLSGANLSGASLPFFERTPEAGAFIGWKKVRGGVILKLEIPSAAKRTSSLVGHKCRASSVLVIDAFGGTGPFQSIYDPTVLYRIGEIIEAKNYSDDIRVECAPGIHFYMSRRAAEDHR